MAYLFVILVYRRKRRIKELAFPAVIKSGNHYIIRNIKSPVIKLSTGSHRHDIICTDKNIRDPLSGIQYPVDQFSRISVGPFTVSEILISKTYTVFLQDFTGHI